MMKNFKTLSMRCTDNRLQILDQTLLPHEEKWLNCRDVKTLVTIIDQLAIRGAPAIGISSCILLGLLAEGGCSRQELEQAAETLRMVRPTAVNVCNNINRLLLKLMCDEYPQAVAREAEEILIEDITLCERMAGLGAALIADGERVLTHCNTGGLATAGVGTAMGVIRTASAQGKDILVYVDETRPLLQGGRLTAWECEKFGIRHQVICDSAAGMLMKEKKVDKILVGSDRIATNGDFANKIGTYSLAVLAAFHQVPFYVVAPQTTVDPDCLDGSAIPIEERDECEVRGAMGEYGFCRWTPEHSPVYNPAFDVTPAGLVTGWILDTGIFTAEDVQSGRWWLTEKDQSVNGQPPGRSLSDHNS